MTDWYWFDNFLKKELSDDISEVFDKLVIRGHYSEVKNTIRSWIKENEHKMITDFINDLIENNEYITNKDGVYKKLVSRILLNVYYDNLLEGLDEDACHHSDPETRVILSFQCIVNNELDDDQIINVFDDQCCEKYR